MLKDLVYAIAVLPAGSAVSLAFRRPRRWARVQLALAWAAVSPRQHEQARQAAARLSAELAELREQRVEDLAVIARLSAELEELRNWRETAERAFARSAAQWADEFCQQEGNPDPEYRADLDAWFRGDASADIDYSRKQARDLARLAAGEFRRR